MSLIVIPRPLESLLNGVNLSQKPLTQSLPIPLRRPPRKRQPPPRTTHARNPNNPLPDPQHARPADILLRAANGVLQPPRLLDALACRGHLLCELHEADDGLRVEGREAIDHAGSAKKDDGAELLAEAAVDAELCVVDLGVGGDLDVEGDVAVGPGGVRRGCVCV